ncbi:MAG: APC family permease [Chlamydiota bacterium]
MIKSKTQKISLFLLVLLVVSAIDSIRNLPSAAIFGPSLIFFFLFSAATFLVPVALVSAQLSSWVKGKGGVYHWIAEAFGDSAGMFGIWLQWINTMVWYPTILSFMAGTLAYLIQPELAENKTYLILVILGIFWLLTLINLFGIRTSTKINSFCALIGTIIPMLLLICLGILWWASGKTMQITFSYQTIVPTLSSLENWISLTVIMASFLGVELAGVHANDIADPQKNFPKAMAYASVFLIATMLLGALSIGIVVPVQEINLVSGIMQVFSDFFAAFSIPAWTRMLAVLILIGSFGSIINWLISPAKGLLHAAECGFLPRRFLRLNRYGVAQNILFLQAVIVSLLCAVFYLVPGVNAFYWFLTALSTDLYMVMYLLLFASAIRLYTKHRGKAYAFNIPGKQVGIFIVSGLGIFSSLLTIFVGFFPPEHIAIGQGYYALLILGGNLLFAAPALLFCRYRKRQKASVQKRSL